MVPQICTDVDGTPYIQIGASKLQLDNRELDGEFLERAEKEIRETPEVKSEALAALRKLLQGII